eukprot:SAG31_NODE_4423_length_3247_cov_2.442503_3_plen_75_part_00
MYRVPTQAEYMLFSYIRRCSSYGLVLSVSGLAWSGSALLDFYPYAGYDSIHGILSFSNLAHDASIHDRAPRARV